MPSYCLIKATKNCPGLLKLLPDAAGSAAASAAAAKFMRLFGDVDKLVFLCCVSPLNRLEFAESEDRVLPPLPALLCPYLPTSLPDPAWAAAAAAAALRRHRRAWFR